MPPGPSFIGSPDPWDKASNTPPTARIVAAASTIQRRLTH